MKQAPLLLFVYRRLYHTQKTVEALVKNKLSDKSSLYIYSDYPKDEKNRTAVSEIRRYIKEIRGFKKIHIIERNKHFGLANSVISGVTDVINLHGKAIVLEDDLVTSPYFLMYVNKALHFYENNKKIYSVTGYTYPVKMPNHYKDQVYLFYRCCSWGWGTWKDRWQRADWEMKDYELFRSNKALTDEFNRGGDDMTDLLDFQMRGKIDSWAIRWCYAHYKNQAYCLYPTISKIINIGLDGSGTHRSVRNVPNSLYNINEQIRFSKNIEPDELVIKNVQKYFQHDTLRKIVHFIKRHV